MKQFGRKLNTAAGIPTPSKDRPAPPWLTFENRHIYCLTCFSYQIFTFFFSLPLCRHTLQSLTKTVNGSTHFQKRRDAPDCDASKITIQCGKEKKRNAHNSKLCLLLRWIDITSNKRIRGWTQTFMSGFSRFALRMHHNGVKCRCGLSGLCRSELRTSA